MTTNLYWMIRPGHSARGLGSTPSFVLPEDERPVREQIAERYVGGWDSFKDFTLNPKTLELSYPGDPTMKPFAFAHLRGETVLLYESAWVAVVQQDGTFDVARLD